MQWLLFPLSLLLACVAAGPVHAFVCSNPPGNEGDEYYNQSYHTMQFCNGSQWIPEGVPGGGNFRPPMGTTAQEPACNSGMEGGVWYNTDISNLQVCDGTAWHLITITSSSCSSLSGLNFTDITGAPLSTLETSAAATITFSGCSSALSVSVTGGGSPQISINGGAWTTSGSIYSGQTLQVRLTSSGSGSTQLTATVTVQTSSTNWHVTTAALDPCTGTASAPTAGQVCTDGSIYAGTTPDGNVEMFVTPCDAGMTGTQGNCTGTRQNIKWSSNNTQTTNVTSQTTGKSNTATLHADDAISPYNADAPFSAADYCYNLNYLGHSDWYLPALGELNIMYQNQTAIGGFQTSTVYWSSSEYSNNNAWSEDFSSGAQGHNGKTLAYVVRCARH